MKNEKDTANSSFSKSGIFALANELQKLQREAVIGTMTFYRPEIERIIRTNNKDRHTIEHTLDALLDVAFDGDILLLFKKLCRYYYNIDPQATADYISYYREMWDSDDGFQRNRRLL